METDEIFWSYCQTSMPEEKRIFIEAWPNEEPPSGPWASVLTGPEDPVGSCFLTHDDAGNNYLNQVLVTTITVNFFRGDTLRDARRFRRYLITGSKDRLSEISGTVTRISPTRPIAYNDGIRMVHRHQLDFSVTWTEKTYRDNQSIKTVSTSGDFTS